MMEMDGWQRDRVIREQQARIEQLERELAIAEKMAADANEAYSQAHVSMIEALDQLTAEKALADGLRGFYLEAIPALKLTRRNVSLVNDMVKADAAYRKARGL